MDRRIELVIARMKSDSAVAWDTPTLAAMVNLSPSRFRHLFKQETGKGPAQYMKEFRLRKAEKMLRTTFFTVKQVLKHVGLGSNAHFVHDFRKMYGMTPTAYRRSVARKSKRKRRKKKSSTALGKK
jgi:AraC family transcriptional regulator, arabinose operon regulatory protein